MKLLERICKGVRYQNYTDIPVVCMNLVASVSDFVQYKKQQVCKVNHVNKPLPFQSELSLADPKCCTYYSVEETQEGDRDQRYAKESISQAMNIMRDWIMRSYRQGLLKKSLSSLYWIEATAEMDVRSLFIF